MNGENFTMAKQSKATKAVIASLLATSAIVPAMAVSAADATTPAAAKTIEFKLEDSMGGILSNYIKSPGALVELEGKQYIQVSVPDAVLALVKTATVNGASIIVEKDGKKLISVPVTADYAPVKIDLELSIGKLTATLTPDKASIKGGAEETKPAEEAKPAEETKPAVEAGKPFTPGKKFESVADGTYDVTIDAYDPETNVGGYTAITRHLSTNAKLVVKEGKYKLQVSPSAASNPMIAGFKVNDKELTAVSGSPTGEVQVFEFEIDSISELYKASVHVVAKAANIDTWYPFGIAINTANLELPKAEVKEEAKPEVKTIPVYVYKDGTNELSIMHNKYLKDEVKVTTTAGGYDVDLTFPEGQYVNNFSVEGATVAIKSEETVEENKVVVYTVSVDNLDEIYTASIDLSVNTAGVVYNTVHKVQLQFGEKAAEVIVVPFKDIEGNEQYDAIVKLYELGIFKAADNFNPNNNLKRADFALMLNRALKLNVQPATNFTDIASFDAETQEAVEALNGYGIINGKTASTFSPSEDISRKEAALMIYRLLEKQGYEATGATADFSDLPKDEEAAKAIAELNSLGIISGFDGKFNPEGKLTRAHMAKIVNNALEALNGLK